MKDTMNLFGKSAPAPSTDDDDDEIPIEIQNIFISTNLNSLILAMNNNPILFKNCSLTLDQYTLAYIFSFSSLNPQTFEWETRSVLMQDLNDNTQLLTCQIVQNTIKHIYND